MQPAYPSLTISEIAQGMTACRTNARELLEEFEALSSRGSFARAYALLHTACEELAKFSILELRGKQLAAGNTRSWKRFWQRFRSHDSKIAQLNVQLLYLLAGSGEASHRNIIESVEKIFDRGVLIRNGALYVDVGPDGKFRKPSDIDFSLPLPALHAATKLALEAADQRGSTVDEIESNLQEPLRESEKQNVLKTLSLVTQRLSAAGLDNDKALEIVEKVLRT